MEGLLRWRTPVALQQRLRKLDVDEMQASGARAARRRRFNTIYADSETLGYRLAANFESVWEQPEYTMRVKTNALGMRERELDAGSAPDTMRILTLGDSFVFGLGVDREQTFQMVLEEQLKKDLGRNVEVLNSGVPGYGTCHQELLLKDLAPRLKPQMVLSCFYVGNDLIDNLHCLEAGVASERVVNGVFMSNKRYHVKSDTFELQNVSNPLKRWLIEYSHAYNFLDMKWSGFAVQMGWRPKPQTLYRSVERFHKNRDGGEEEKVYDLTKQLLARMRDSCRAQGAQFAIALFPGKTQIVPELFNEQLRGFNVKAEDYAADKPNRKLREICKELDIPVVDLYEAFRARANERLYYEVDGHWTADGHRVAAEELRRFVAPMAAKKE